jgi:hypothetical protein
MHLNGASWSSNYQNNAILFVNHHANKSRIHSGRRFKYEIFSWDCQFPLQEKRIQSLVQDEGVIEGHEQLKSYITSYYKGLSGPPDESSFSVDESQIADISQVSHEENAVLTAFHSEEEVNKTIFQMEKNKAPGSDGFPAEFYQTFWDTIKDDLLQMFGVLHAGQLELFRLILVMLSCYPKLKRQKGSNKTHLPLKCTFQDIHESGHY